MGLPRATVTVEQDQRQTMTEQGTRTHPMTVAHQRAKVKRGEP